MQDMLSEIYNTLIQNDIIKKYLYDEDEEDFRITYYEESETRDLNKQAFLIIRPLEVPTPSLYGSDKELNIEFMYQIDVQSMKRKDVKIIQREVRKTLEELNLYQLRNGFDEYFKETKRFVDARRYKGHSKIYNTNY